MGQIISHPSTAQWLAQQEHHIPDFRSKGQRGKWQKTKWAQIARTLTWQAVFILKSVHALGTTGERPPWSVLDGKLRIYFGKDSEERWKRCSKEWVTGWSWLLPGSMPVTPFTSWKNAGWPSSHLDVCNVMALGLKAGGGQCLHYVLFLAEGAH